MSRPSRRRRAVAIRHVPFEDLGVLAALLHRRGYDVAYRDAAIDDFGARLAAFVIETKPFASASWQLISI